MMEKVYLSGPLFSQAEIDWGSNVKASIIESFGDRVEVLWPHEMTAGPLSEIFQSNIKALADCKIMVAILEGSQVDDGTSWEMGYHYARGGMILGIRTDFRKAGEAESSKVNLMIENSCLMIVDSLPALISSLEEILEH